MLDGKRILAVIPARGGSKGIKLKNLRKVQGKTLIRHVAEVLDELSWFDAKVVSTDHELIKAEAVACGLSVPFLRPENLSGDLVPDIAVLQHVIVEMERFGDQFDFVVMLQPTSPLRRAVDIDQAVKLCMAGHYDSVWTVSTADLKYHPLKALTLSASGNLRLYSGREGSKIVARQQLNEVFYRNGVAYVFASDYLRTANTLDSDNMGGLLLDKPLVSIDTEDDLVAVEKVLAAQSPQI